MTELVFLTGCGRSGTTILGRALARHPEVTYLNDRFDLWIESLPIADIWGLSGGSAGRIELTAGDLERPGMHDGIMVVQERLEAQRAGSRVVVEKLAINNFRMGFLHAAFPEAAFINITRHGVEVAASIAEKIDASEWYGEQGRKWTMMCEHARERGLADTAENCRNSFERGLLEWRLSVESAARFLEDSNEAHDSMVVDVRYERLIKEPGVVISGVFDSLRLPIDAGACAWADENIARQTRRAVDHDERRVREIAGDALGRLGYGVLPYADSLA